MTLTGRHWDFALRIYASPGVAKLCLDLQEHYGVDVNVLLIALFAWAERQVVVNADDVAAADAAVRAWRDDVVHPLRAIRRRLKSGPPPAPDHTTEDLRTTIKSAELRAEQIEQAVLAGWLDRLTPHGAGDDASVADIVDTVVRFYASPHDRTTATPVAFITDIDISPLQRALRA